MPAVANEDKDANDTTTTFIFKENESIEYVITYNEYDTVTALAKESNLSLMRAGYSLNEIKEIKNYEEAFHNHIDYLNSTYSDEELLKLGYTSEEVKLLRSDNVLKYSSALAANLSMYFSTVPGQGLKYQNGVNTIAVRYGFDWTRVPSMKYTDAFSIGWDNRFGVNNSNSNHPNGRVTIPIVYVPINSFYNNVIDVKTMDMLSGGSTFKINFDMKKGDIYNADRAESIVYLKYPSNIESVSQIRFSVSYAHAKAPTTFSYTIPNTGVGIDFNESILVDSIYSSGYLY
ncbi:hypothetical protein [Methanolapillus millepedarum]